MNVDAELDRMKQAIFTEDLLTKLLSCSQKTLDAQGSTVPPEEAQAARAALEDLLTPQQKQILAALEEKHRDILRRLLPFAVQQGLCTGFQQYFSNEPLTTPLPGLVTQRCWIKPSTAPATPGPASRPQTCLTRSMTSCRIRQPRTNGPISTWSGRTGSISWPWTPSTWATAPPCGFWGIASAWMPAFPCSPRSF